MFFELLIPPEPFIQDEPHFFCHKFYKNMPYKDKLALAKELGFSSVEEQDAYAEAHKTDHYADPLDKEIDGIVDAKMYSAKNIKFYDALYNKCEISLVLPELNI
jgi:hypothetical protein